MGKPFIAVFSSNTSFLIFVWPCSAGFAYSTINSLVLRSDFHSDHGGMCVFCAVSSFTQPELHRRKMEDSIIVQYTESE